jgi:hypothetical protein
MPKFDLDKIKIFDTFFFDKERAKNLSKGGGTLKNSQSLVRRKMWTVLKIAYVAAPIITTAYLAKQGYGMILFLAGIVLLVIGASGAIYSASSDFPAYEQDWLNHFVIKIILTATVWGGVTAATSMITQAVIHYGLLG